MNNRIEIHSLTVAFKDGTSKGVSSKTFDILLNPFYASIHDIEIAMPMGKVEFSEEFMLKVSEIIFNKSIYIDLYVKHKKINLSPEDMFILKRDYVICATLAQIATLIYSGTLKGQSVKKILGDFHVERENTWSTGDTLNFGKEAKDCVDEILAAIDELTGPLAESFVLGRFNCKNYRSDRLWHHPKYLSRMPIGANKYLEQDGRYYKTGFGHGNEHLPLYRRD